MKPLSIAILAVLCTAGGAAAQKPPIEVHDGDVIIVRDTAKVRIVRRSEGNVRVVYNAAEHWLIVLIDQGTPEAPPDGRVDSTYNFQDLTGEWPLGDRWEGHATIDDYSVAGEMSNLGIGLTTPGGLVQVLGGLRNPRDGRTFFGDPSAVATVTFTGSGRGGARDPFDQAEQRQTDVARRNAAGRAGGSVRLTGVPGNGAYPPPQAPVRVGGNIRTPAKIQDAAPVVPAELQAAGLSGIVILEIVIGPDGGVTDAKVLRGIPPLDRAAVEAARKWRYEPTLLNGAPVPVIMTVTVPFR